MLRTVRRLRVGLLAALVALLMLVSALPASADPGAVKPSNITWERGPAQPLNITWE